MKTIQDLINFFEPIPENRWCSFTRDGDGQCCALGHIDEKLCDFGASDRLVGNIIGKDAKPLNLKRNAQGFYHGPAGCLAAVNNGECLSYPQSTEKQRVLAFLHDLQNDQEINEVNISEITQIISQSKTLELA